MRTFYFMKSTTIKQFLSYSNLILLIINKIILTYQLDIKIILFSLKMTWNDNLNVLYINIKLNQENAMYLQPMMQKKFLLKEMAIKNYGIHTLRSGDSFVPFISIVKCINTLNVYLFVQMVKYVC